MDHGLLFKGQMVRALLDRLKTQTRRVVTWHNSYLDGRRVGHQGELRRLWDSLDWSRAVVDRGPSPAGNPGPYFKAPSLLDPADETWHRVYPIYAPGELIWARETWGLLWPDDSEDGLIYDDAHSDGRVITNDECRVVYRADEARGNPDAPKWQSAMLMPRRYSRITLEITQVRAQRVREISEGDAVAEGLARDERTGFYLPGQCASPRWAFEALWDSINAPRGKGWAMNPHVWALTFKAVEARP